MKNGKESVVRDRWPDCRSLPRALTFHLLHLTSYALLMILAGCNTAGYAVKTSNNNFLSAEDILKRIEESRNSAQSLKGTAKIRINTTDVDTSVNEVMVVKKPSSVRLETLSFFGNPMFIIASDGENVNIFSGKKFESGRLSSGKMVSAPFPFNLLAMDDIATIFLGCTPVIRFESSEINYSDSRHILTLHSADGFKKQTIWMDAETRTLLKSEISDEGLGSTLSLDFGKYHDMGGVLFPKEINIRLSPNQSILEIHYDEIELNSQVDDTNFALRPADGAEMGTIQ